MTLIPNTNPDIVAYYKDGDHRFTLPVLAFNSDGDPLVASEETGQLVLAETLYGYGSIDDGSYQPGSFTPAYNPEVCLELYSDDSEDTKRVQIHGWFSSRSGQVPAVASPHFRGACLVPLEPWGVPELFPGYTKSCIAYRVDNH